MGENQMGFLLFGQAKAGVGGAIAKGKEYKPTKDGAKVYLNGDSDLLTVLDRVVAAGGKILVEKTLIAPGMGHFASLDDTEGNVVHLHSPY